MPPIGSSSSRSAFGSLLGRPARSSLASSSRACSLRFSHTPADLFEFYTGCLTVESATTRDAPAKTGIPTLYPSTDLVTSHLNHLLEPLSLQSIPDALAERLVTHRSAAGRLGNHNGKLAFYGRRVLHFHLALALHKQGFISQSILEQHLSPIELGRSGGVGAALRLEQIMRWRPALPSHYAIESASKEDALGRGSGLWRLRGETVQSLQGAIWSHYVCSILLLSDSIHSILTFCPTNREPKHQKTSSTPTS